MTQDEADNKQNWRGMDGAVAFHLIERHADNWQEIGQMMDAWLRANSDRAALSQPAGGAEAVAFDRERIKRIALSSGFLLKQQTDGSYDLHQYVYDFAAKLINPPAATVPDNHQDCCDTPSYCSSVRRCTRMDAAPTPPVLTRDAFIAGYCERSGITPEKLSALGQVAVPCSCGEPGCCGWAMVENTPEALARHRELYDTDEGCRALPQYIKAHAALAEYEKAKEGGSHDHHL